MDTFDDLSYDIARYPIPELSKETILDALRPNADDNLFNFILQSLIKDSHGNERQIPINGNQEGPFWDDGKDTPITYAIRLSYFAHNLHHRIAQLVSVLYLKCGIPVTGSGSAFENPLTICYNCDNLSAATALLRDTDAHFVTCLPSFATCLPWQEVLRSMVVRRRTKMLQLFAEYKPRTFPEANEFLNDFEGRESKDIPLFIAVSSNDPELVHVLIYEFGANPYIRDNENKMAIDTIINKDPILDYYGIQLDFSVERDKRRDIIRLLDPRGNFHALYMSKHPRLGSDSQLRWLSEDNMNMIHMLSLQENP